MDIDAFEFWQKLEQDGEEVVRRRLAEGVYAKKKRDLAEEWLRKRDRDQDQKRHDEIAAVAKSAKLAAWVAAIAAILSAIAAILAYLFAK